MSGITLPERIVLLVIVGIGIVHYVHDILVHGLK